MAAMYFHPKSKAGTESLQSGLPRRLRLLDLCTWLLLACLCATCAPAQPDPAVSSMGTPKSGATTDENQPPSPPASAYVSAQRQQDLSTWVGRYDYDREDGRDPVGAQIAVHYDLEIRQDSCFFASIGYQTYFREVVSVRVAGDSLYIRFHSLLDGSNFHDEHPDLGMLYRQGKQTWWVSPPFLEDERTLMVKSED